MKFYSTVYSMPDLLLNKQYTSDSVKQVNDDIQVHDF